MGHMLSRRPGHSPECSRGEGQTLPGPGRAESGGTGRRTGGVKDAQRGSGRNGACAKALAPEECGVFGKGVWVL